MPTDEANRKLRRHKKSRGGCGNCKLRKIKCDENKPTCERCKIYGTFCNYDSRYSELQPISCDTSFLPVLEKQPYSGTQSVLMVLNGRSDLQQSGSAVHPVGNYTYTPRDIEQIDKLYSRTIFTLPAHQNFKKFQKAYNTLTYAHPFLLHTAIALTILHDQYLLSTEDPKLSAAVAFHWARGAALMNEKLSSKLTSDDRDALWCCAGLLGALSFAAFLGKTPEESWPLSENSSFDLGWLKMSEGKKAIWKIADPQRPDSIFHSTAPDFVAYASTTSASISYLKNLPSELLQLCGLHDSILNVDNPYLASASFLAEILEIDSGLQSVGRMLCFFGGMHPGLKSLLMRKDPCALLLLALWYAKMYECTQCWIWQRTYLEYHAILKYLRLHYSHESRIVEVVKVWERTLLQNSVGNISLFS
ncbi:C6 finger domain-containing protein [Phlyctema vagabunda]|uniref:C6 finger domain-containing protein n=1 Tax=Phlyctema vagabunda TaxID=108571 RepID=A0ABR4PTJ4_9HELO